MWPEGDGLGMVWLTKNHLRATKKAKIRVAAGYRNTFMEDPERAPNDAKCCSLVPGRRRLAANSPGLVVNPCITVLGANYKCTNRE